ncbi:MAG TPA: hemolysin family protein [Bacteroidales bacterium]|nr:hemolysin family protein [Bacteroidales bacterium]
MEIIIISLLILLNGFFALSEIALVSSKKARLEHLRSKGNNGADTALRLLENSGNFLSAIQVGITLIGIVTGVFGGLSIAQKIEPLFYGIAPLREFAGEISLTITIITITCFSIIIGELVPKTIALSNPEKIAVKIAPPIHFFSVLFYPFVRFLSWSTSLINRILGIKKHNEQLTEAELRQLIRTASREGVIEKYQNQLHEKVFYFSDKKARHIMTHRVEVEWIDLTKPQEKIKEDLLRSHHAILVCGNGSLENFEGILSLRDYYSALVTSGNVNIRDLLSQPEIVPESMDANRVLEKLKKSKKHFSIVVNEYGSFEGIITVHDIMENIIGDVPEEGESYEPDIYVRDDKSFLVSGDAPVEVLDGILENYITDFEKIDYSTVAGFVLFNIKKIPRVGDKFEHGAYTIEIVDIDGKRIDKILIRKKETQDQLNQNIDKK